MRSLESFRVEVLAAFIRRRNFVPSNFELEEIERALQQPPESDPVCPQCQNNGIEVDARKQDAWCYCPAAEKIRCKYPDFVTDWNARAALGLLDSTASIPDPPARDVSFLEPQYTLGEQISELAKRKKLK